MAGKSVLKNLISSNFRVCQIRSVSSAKSNVVIGRIDDGVHSWQQIRVGIIGAPFAMGQVKLDLFLKKSQPESIFRPLLLQPHQGVEKAPPLIRQTGIIERLKELGAYTYCVNIYCNTSGSTVPGVTLLLLYEETGYP